MQALYAWDMARPPVDELLSLSWLDERLQDTDTLSFARLLIAGTIENIAEVDKAVASHLEHWAMERLSRVDLAVLRLGAYSLLFQPDVPASVVIDEAIDIAREFGSDDSYRFVNGVLDAVRRDRDR